MSYVKRDRVVFEEVGDYFEFKTKMFISIDSEYDGYFCIADIDGEPIYISERNQCDIIVDKELKMHGGSVEFDLPLTCIAKANKKHGNCDFDVSVSCIRRISEVE